MTNLEKYLVIAAHLKLTKEALEEAEALYDNGVSVADAFYKELNELDARYATGTYGGTRISIEIIGFEGVQSRIGVMFDVDRSKGPGFDQIKEMLSTITADQCMLISDKTIIIATYNANTKTLY